MLLAPKRPTRAAMEQCQATRAEPVLVVDPFAGALLGANVAGWAAWGLDPATAKPPVDIDCAMPAMQRLRQVAECTHQTGDTETLTFWTARGLARFHCRLEASAAVSAG